ncbi:hypothetical protein [uncultured Croceitalea sp.]|uniref:hypothetical protein n=1 Tax=uncultured Croceitalea sp. TaxID=1798908 RepID=UPI0033066DF7
MKHIIIILLLLTQISFGQTADRIERNFPNNHELKTENLITKYNQFDFSKIWTLTANNNVLGIIGEDHQRIKIKLISVKKSSLNPNEYYVTGKSCVKGTICDFSGIINLTEIKEVKELHFGVDDEYADKGIKSQGILIADYEFKENSEQRHSGIFKGKLHSKWYLNSKNQIEYDNIEFISDGYLNNAFNGIWKSYSTGKEKICNWGDYRVPKSNRDFDIGAGEFSPNEKYFKKGWAEYKPLDKDDWWK